MSNVAFLIPLGILSFLHLLDLKSLAMRVIALSLSIITSYYIFESFSFSLFEAIYIMIVPVIIVTLVTLRKKQLNFLSIAGVYIIQLLCMFFNKEVEFSTIVLFNIVGLLTCFAICFNASGKLAKKENVGFFVWSLISISLYVVSLPFILATIEGSSIVEFEIAKIGLFIFGLLLFVVASVIALGIFPFKSRIIENAYYSDTVYVFIHHFFLFFIVAQSLIYIFSYSITSLPINYSIKVNKLFFVFNLTSGIFGLLSALTAKRIEVFYQKMALGLINMFLMVSFVEYDLVNDARIMKIAFTYTLLVLVTCRVMKMSVNSTVMKYLSGILITFLLYIIFSPNLAIVKFNQDILVNIYQSIGIWAGIGIIVVYVLFFTNIINLFNKVQLKKYLSRYDDNMSLYDLIINFLLILCMYVISK